MSHAIASKLTSGQNMASDHSAFMKKYNATTQRILAERSESRDAGSTTRIGITNRGAVVLMVIGASSHKVHHFHLITISQC